MKRLTALFIIATLPLSNGAYAQSAKPPTSKSASISKSADLSQEKVPLAKKRKKKLPPKPKQKWPPPGFEKKGELYAKTARYSTPHGIRHWSNLNCVRRGRVSAHPPKGQTDLLYP